MRKIAILGLLVLLAMVAIPTASADADLNVTDIEVNPSCNNVYDEIFVNGSNEICATVYNAGPDGITDDFDVCLYNNSVLIGSITVSGLAADTNTTVCIDWTPSPDGVYSGLSGEHPADGIPTTLSVTVDCNGAITETDETNNTLLLNTEVSANGYKSKDFDSDPNTRPLTPFKYAGDLFTGGLAYSVSGTKDYPFDPSETQTRVHNIELPSGVTVKEARLYVVWYDYFYNPVPGCLPNLSVDFAGPCGSVTFTTPDAMYTDQKAYGTWDTPKGKYAYNVTSLVCDTSNDYSVTVENIDPANSTTLLGGILVVVYEGGCSGEIQLWWQEGCEYLSGRTSYCSSTTEATATVELPGSIMATVGTANLITFVDQGMDPGSNMLFNGNVIKTDAWDASTEAYPNSKINVETVSVKSDLLASGNNMGFQDIGTSGMQADLAFLIVEEEPNATVYFEPSDSGADYDNTTTVGVWVDTSKALTGGTVVFDYALCCANVTGYTSSTIIDWDFMNMANLNVPGKVTIGFGSLNVAGRGPGLLHIGDLDIHCCNESYCETGLIWDCSASTLDRLGGGIVDPVKWEDGTFRCTNLPDLDITEVYGTPATGDNYTVSYTVKNIGNANASAGHTTTLYIDGVVKDHDIPVELVPGGTYTGTFGIELTMTAPNDLMKVCADTGDDCMEIDETNNCMESFYPAGIEIKVDVLDDGECVDFQEQFLVNIDIDPRNIPVYGVQYVLSFDNTVLHAEWQNEGTFLNSDGAETNMYINTIDNGAGTISFAATRVGDVGGIANPPGTLAVIKFTASQQGGSSNLTLRGVVAANELGNEIDPVDLIDDEVCISSNIAPVAIGESLDMYNNDGQKYICKVYFDGTASYDPDGALVNWRWSYGDGNYGTGETVDHVYQSWNWNTTTSEYEPFSVSLTVTDNADPHQLDNTTSFDVIVYTAGDANADGKVNILDATIVGLEWGQTTTYGTRTDQADLNNDDTVNILDAVIIGTCWGHTAW